MLNQTKKYFWSHTLRTESNYGWKFPNFSQTLSLSAFIREWQLVAIGVTWPFRIMWHQLEDDSWDVQAGVPVQSRPLSLEEENQVGQQNPPKEAWEFQTLLILFDIGTVFLFSFVLCIELRPSTSVRGISVHIPSTGLNNVSCNIQQDCHRVALIWS